MKVSNRLDEAEERRRRNIRESNFSTWVEANKEQVEKVLDEKRLAGVSAVDQAAWTAMHEHFPETFDEIYEFEREFPDCNGSFIWAMKAKIFREKGGIWI